MSIALENRMRALEAEIIVLRNQILRLQEQVIAANNRALETQMPPKREAHAPRR